MLQIVDTQWKDHLYSLDHLKEGIGLRGYGQKDPLVEYKRESFDLFQAMKERIDDRERSATLWRLRPIVQGERRQRRPDAPPPSRGLPDDAQRPGDRQPAFAGGRRPWLRAVPQPARTGGDDAAVRTVRRQTPRR